MFTYFFTPQKNAFISQTLFAGFFLAVFIFAILGSLVIFTGQVINSLESPISLSVEELSISAIKLISAIILLMWGFLTCSNFDKFKCSYYELSNNIIHVSTGHILKKEDMYLFAKDIQHITIQSDLISRRFGHFDVVLYTAGTNQRLHCLKKSDADFIKEFLEKRNC